MNEKGFTLTELLAIVALMGVIALVAIPNLTKEIKKNEDEQQKLLNKKIENASKLYASKYYANDLINGNIITFTLNDLESDGFLDLSDDECAEKDGKKKEDVKITVNNEASYDYSEIAELNNCYK